MFANISLTYSPEKEAAYDQRTYAGRILHFLRYTNPMNAFTSSAKIEEYKQLLKDFDRYGPQPEVSDKQLWTAKYALMANLHPDTGKEIPRIFRMSSFVLVNIPIAIGLALTAPTVFNVGFWQVVNQSYNFGVNVVNANATNASADYSELLKSYGLAVTSAATVSLSALHLIKRSRWNNNAMFLRLAPFCGVAVASCLNLFSSRYKDTKEGILIRDAQTGDIISDHKSPTAGKIAFSQCALTRGVFIPFIVTMLPPLVISQMQKMGKLPRTAIGNHAFNIGLVAMILQFALPSGLAMFPQEAVINRTKLEPYFQNLRNSRGELIENFTFNRGL
jgi:tricarboxylate carrier